MKIFDMAVDRQLGQKLARYLKVELASLEERVFEDTEFKVRPLESVRGESVFVCQSLYADADLSANDKLIRLLFFIGALKDALADRVTAVVPYLAYQRKDRRTKTRDPISTRYIAQIFESVGVDAIVTVDVHNLAAFDNSFRCPKVHIEAAPLLVEHFAPMVAAAQKTVVVSPDIGGAKRARAFASVLSERTERPVDLAFVEKHRSSGIVSGELFAGDVNNAAIIVIDDMICGGTTMARAAQACVLRGATDVHVAATHGVFGSSAAKNLTIAEITSVVVTDTVADSAARCSALSPKLVILDTAPLIGEVLERIIDRR